MKYFFSTILFFLSFSGFCQSIATFPPLKGVKSISPNQPANVQRDCGTMTNLAKLIENNPLLAQQIEDTRTSIHQYALTNADALSQQKTIYNIPVVVHVVSKDATQDISNAQIQSQIDALNRDYRKTNSDVSLVPPDWTGLAADVEIQFCLASVDPSGAATTGITRNSTPASSFFTDANNNVKFASTGGANAWNSQKYLNLWVCDLDGSILGYAQFPGGPLATDGVVIDYADFGTNGTATYPFDKGRTATHEIGHWLGLYHIWGDEPNCANDDGIADTPLQKDKNFGCPSFPLGSGQSGGSCSGASPGSMFMNYMDYTNDACMYMFTTGQKTEMLATLTVNRASLLNSNGCGTNPNATTCDSISNYLVSDTPQLYTPIGIGSTGVGYISGTNNYNDKAKADKYSGASGLYVKGLWIDFGHVNFIAATDTLNYCVWDGNGISGIPGTQLATKSVTLQTINNNFLAGNPTYVEFPNNNNGVNGFFYCGISFDPTSGDTIAVITNTANITPNKAWEQWGDNSWHEYSETPASWGVSLSHAIFPVLCSLVNTFDLPANELSNIELFPNPANEKLLLHFGVDKESENYQLRIFNLLGDLLSTQTIKTNNSSTVSIETSGLENGMYLIEITSENNRLVKKFNIIH